ncbi:NAD(P)/FAD-dependent oxidoreductase [Brevundimonas sp.]
MEPTMPHDAVIIGGSYAGLSAAIQLVRARRRVLIIDDGKPRNRFAARAHGALGQDGRPGAEITAAARTQVAAYPTAAFRHVEAVDINAIKGGFEITLADGTRTSGRRLLLSQGVTDRLPELPGIHERWGRTVLHCPYCHGYEIGGGPIGVLGASAMSIHQALLIADWGQVTLFLNDVVQPTDEESRQLARRGVIVEPMPVTALEGDAPSLTGARLSDGRLVPLRALFLGVGVRQTGALAETLGCALDETPMGRIIRVDDFKQTTVPGVYAAGDVARMASNITLASADGVMAGIGMHRSLIEEEMA